GHYDYVEVLKVGVVSREEHAVMPDRVSEMKRVGLPFHPLILRNAHVVSCLGQDLDELSGGEVIIQIEPHGVRERRVFGIWESIRSAVLWASSSIRASSSSSGGFDRQ